MVAVSQVDQDLEQKLKVPTSMRGETPGPMYTDEHTSCIGLKIMNKIGMQQMSNSFGQITVRRTKDLYLEEQTC